MSAVHHPIFARVYPLVARMGERVEGEHRDRLLAGLRGRVVEVGCGHGINFARYPPEVEEVLGVEPEPHLRQRAAQAATEAPVAVRVVDGLADSLPLGDSSADAVVCSLVLCSVPEQAAALAEAKRVLRPGGELRFFEHVLAQEPRSARWQRRIQPLWGRLAGGCHLDRDTTAAIAAAGFEIDSLERFDVPGAGPAKPHVLGVARAAG
jgi:ubiquinone/menaquinone biosynthesis C-methylase UbiE